MNGTTNSIWRWLKCLSPSVWSEKLLRLSLSVKDQTSDSACLSAPYIPADYSQKEQPSDTCFVLFFFPPKLFVMPFLSNFFPYDNQMSETWSLRYNQSQRTCHYPYCKPTYSLNVKKIADDKCGLIRNTCLGGVLMGRVWVLADEKHRICSLRCEPISFRKRIKKWKKITRLYIYI